ncbi:hypothetical protein Poli38472_003185 [Pythium oligandrum]|uniref:HECT-type E3 ubiquitin transferase n=1 Tax=Pythium oligandrum TaxID=41045 RepID=A0A8K1C6J4_PYTOL|nr:hypothetical protein Poli38472_003185 [Pythium oligandrum]|eukprot:TMW57260.1 hypothetical protein Poli38472_003185 [Pythium oligandrum]
MTTLSTRRSLWTALGRFLLWGSCRLVLIAAWTSEFALSPLPPSPSPPSFRGAATDSSSQLDAVAAPETPAGTRPRAKTQVKSDNVEVSLVLLAFVLLLGIGALCSLYSVCRQVKCESDEPHRIGRSGSRSGSSSFQAMLTRSPNYFREDLLNEDELLRLWICVYCDFANYEMKTQCALCGNEKEEKEIPTTPRSRAQTIRPASLFASMATTISSSARSFSPSFLNIGSPRTDPDQPTTAPPSPAPSSSSEQEPSSPRMHSSSSSSTPPSPSARSTATVKRRKEWQSVLDPRTGNIVWEHCARHNDEEDGIPDALITQTAFVSHNTISPEHPHGKIEFVAAPGATVYGSSRPEYYNLDSEYLFLDPSAIETLRELSFPEKHRWFMQETTSLLHVRWENPTMTTKNDMNLLVPRENLFHGTMHALIDVSQKQLRRPLRVRFLNEPGIDAGGIVREWFGLVINEFLDEKNGLFQVVHSSEGEGLAYTIHPMASVAVPDHLLYFRAFGRLLGKALLEGHLINVPLADFLLKHLLSVPVSFVDLHTLDGRLAKSLQMLSDTILEDVTDDDDDPYALDFTIYHTALGVVELKPNGRDLVVNEENKQEYVELFTRWHLGEAMREEIAALVSGLYDVLPVHLLAPFDYHELRLLLCGSPSIDVDDWEQHTFVLGKRSTKSARMIQWFWRIVRSFTTEEQMRLLQYATGSARVPVQGFKALTSSDGRLCPFTLFCLPKDECVFIRAYTCFNRLDLPIYKKEKDLEEALRFILLMDVTGFSIQ